MNLSGPPSKATESFQETEEKFRRIIETNLDLNRECFHYELNKMYRLIPNKSYQTKKTASKPLNIICKFRTHHFREYLFSKTKDVLNITDKKVNFRVSLIKYRSDLLHVTNTYVSNNTNGKVKFCFADSLGNLKIKFFDNKNVSYNLLQSFLEALLDKKLGNREIEKQLFNHDRKREGDEWK